MQTVLEKTTEKEEALQAFLARFETNKHRKRTSNESLPAGSPMHFDCKGCRDDIEVLENYLTRPEHCPICIKLYNAGWLQEFQTIAANQ